MNAPQPDSPAVKKRRNWPWYLLAMIVFIGLLSAIYNQEARGVPEEGVVTQESLAEWARALAEQQSSMGEWEIEVSNREDAVEEWIEHLRGREAAIYAQEKVCGL